MNKKKIRLIILVTVIVLTCLAGIYIWQLENRIDSIHSVEYSLYVSADEVVQVKLDSIATIAENTMENKSHYQNKRDFVYAFLEKEYSKAIAKRRTIGWVIVALFSILPIMELKSLLFKTKN